MTRRDAAEHALCSIELERMTIGTAKIIETAGLIIVRYMNRTSFLVGEQTFGHRGAALEFCRDRGLRVL